MAGLDCWGLVRLVYQKRLGIELPSYTDQYVTVEDTHAIASLIDGERSDWYEVPFGAEKAYDLITVKWFGEERHIGLVARMGHMLHIAEERTSVIESYMGPTIFRRIGGFYRHRHCL